VIYVGQDLMQTTLGAKCHSPRHAIITLACTRCDEKGPNWRKNQRL